MYRSPKLASRLAQDTREKSTTLSLTRQILTHSLLFNVSSSLKNNKRQQNQTKTNDRHLTARLSVCPTFSHLSNPKSLKLFQVLSSLIVDPLALC